MPEETPLRLREQFPAGLHQRVGRPHPRRPQGRRLRAEAAVATREGVTVKPYYRVGRPGGARPQLHAAPGTFPFVRGSGVPWAIEDTFAPPADAIRADEWHDRVPRRCRRSRGRWRPASIVWPRAPAPARASMRPRPSMTFVFAVGSLYFLEIAKLRAARLAWAQACGRLRAGEPGLRACAPARPDRPHQQEPVPIRTPTCCAPPRRRSPPRLAAATG